MRSTVYLAAVVMVAASAGLMPATALAQSRSTDVSDARVAELLRLVAGTAGQQPAVPGGVPAAGNVSDVPLKIEEAVAMALEKNLDIAVERLNPSSFDFSLEALRATFNPTATSTVGYNSTYQLPTSQLVGGARVKNDQATWNFGLQQLLPWWGGSYQVQFNSRRPTAPVAAGRSSTSPGRS